MLDFNPNEHAKAKAWASYVPGRTTKAAFSTHKTAAHAKTALGWAKGIIYELVADEWVERFRRDDADVQICHKCGAGPSYEWKVVGSKHGYVRNPDGKSLHGGWKLKQKDAFEYVWYCYDCGR